MGCIFNVPFRAVKFEHPLMECCRSDDTFISYMFRISVCLNVHTVRPQTEPRRDALPMLGGTVTGAGIELLTIPTARPLLRDRRVARIVKHNDRLQPLAELVGSFAPKTRLEEI